MSLLTNKIILIMGGTSGIGEETAKFLAKNNTVIFTGRRAELGFKIEKKINNNNGKSKFIQCDVCIEDDIENVIKYIESKYGKLDAAINNFSAVNITDFSMLHERNLEQWNKDIQIDLTGYFLSMKYELKLMLKNNIGNIINMSSVAGFNAITVPYTSYIAAKHAIIGMTKDVAAHYGAFNIRANTICPGFIKTEMSKPILKNEELKEFLVAETALKKIGEIKDITNAINWLLSDESSFVTGHSLVIDGGKTIF